MNVLDYCKMLASYLRRNYGKKKAVLHPQDLGSFVSRKLRGTEYTGLMNK